MEGKEPIGGQWNFDAENRKGFGAKGPGTVPPPARFAPDRVTQDWCANALQGTPARWTTLPGP
ncbi:MAG: hypothetical protein RLZZ329_1551 [Pseudomonadota bacterium]